MRLTTAGSSIEGVDRARYTDVAARAVMSVFSRIFRVALPRAACSMAWPTTVEVTATGDR